MSKFFKSAAFPILIVVVLAFFAQKLIGTASHTQKQTFGTLVSDLNSGQIKSLSLHVSNNIVNATTTSGEHFTVGYPDQYANTLVNTEEEDQPAEHWVGTVRGMFTFRQMAKSYSLVSPYRELRHSLSELRLNDLQVGRDGRNRRVLSAFRSRTGRNCAS